LFTTSHITITSTMTFSLQLLLLAALISNSESIVQFTQSILYDEYDIWQPQTTLFITQLCKSGCSVYASIPDNERTRTAAKNVFITDGTTETTLFDVVGLYDTATSQKKSIDFPVRE
ncbi:hypothetical protein PFISCL1PPCAC_18512, partial [Pristionchus fissidentatus]